MEALQRMVNEFRKAMDLPISEYPRTLSPEEAKLHIKMIRDEFEKEFVPAFLEQDLVEMYDAGIDVIYYVIGALSNAGLDLEPGFKEIQRGNMSKMDPVTGKAIKAGPNDPSGEPEGKVLKGPNYRAPNLHPIINEMYQFGAEDTTVYRTGDLPLTLGEGGPRIGSGRVVMDHQGAITFEGVVFDTDTLPLLESVSISDVYIPADDDIVDAEIVEDEGYDGPPMIARLQEGLPDHEGRPVVNLEDMDVDFNQASSLMEVRPKGPVVPGVFVTRGVNENETLLSARELRSKREEEAVKDNHVKYEPDTLEVGSPVHGQSSVPKEDPETPKNNVFTDVDGILKKEEGVKITFLNNENLTEEEQAAKVRQMESATIRRRGPRKI